MERRIINPWEWQDELGYVQAVEISNHQRILFCAGQTPTNAAGEQMHADDMRAQVTLVMDNLQTVLDQANFTLSNIVRLNLYTTDVDRFIEAIDVVMSRLAEAGCRIPANLIGVARLGRPEWLVEIEATAVA